MFVASALSWRSVLAMTSAPSTEVLLMIVIISSIVELPKCMFLDRGDISMFLSSTSLSSPLYSDRSALIKEESMGAGCQRGYMVPSCRKTSHNGLMSASVVSHQATLNKNRKMNIVGEWVGFSGRIPAEGHLKGWEINGGRNVVVCRVAWALLTVGQRKRNEKGRKA